MDTFTAKLVERSARAIRESRKLLDRINRTMPNPKRPRDANQLAKMIVDLTTGDEQEPELTAKQKAGRLGGLKGGKARYDALTPERRSEIAKDAAKKRWDQKQKNR